MSKLSGAADPCTGVKCFSIGGRMLETRQRCLGMTDEERRWRAQWLKDQILTPEEPRDVPEFYKETTNIFRRLYKTPMHMLYKSLKSSMGHDIAFSVRHVLGKLTMGFITLYVVTYYLKYHSNDFTVTRPIDIHHARPIMFPDHPDFPNYHEKEPYEYYDQGFYSSVLCQKVEPPPPPPVEPPVVFPEDSPCAANTEQTNE